MATGLVAWKIAKGLYIVPLLFAYTPLLAGDVLQVAEIFIFGVLGLYAASAGLQGFLGMPLNGLMRLLLLLVAAALLWPGSLGLHLGGGGALAGLALLSHRRSRRAAAPAG